MQYDTKQKQEQILYNQVLEQEIDNNKVTITGYLPSDAVIEIKIADYTKVEQQLKDYINEKNNLQLAYDIKIISGEKEFEPNELGEEVEVTIQGINSEDNKTYKVIHINDDQSENVENTDKDENSENNEKIEEIEEVETTKDGIKFKANEFSTYAVLSEETEDVNVEESNTQSDVVTLAEEPQQIFRSIQVKSTVNAWDGSIADSFSWGNGTESEPYLIVDGKELAYLAEQVRNGNTFAGQYFQITNDIDLNNMAWTPIGTNQNSFQGILDGAGHTISNAKITVSNLPDRTYETYGIFASIGGGNTRTIIRNVELSNINIDITASGNTGSTSIFGTNQDAEGLHIGTLTGAMYRNASILNVIVKDSLIQDTNVINIIDSPFQFSVGGIVGYIANTYNNNTNPGINNTYVIDNCYSETIISLDATAASGSGWFGSSYNGHGHYHTGGIVGTIRGQAVWPTNSLYAGTIDSNGFIGPIFGALINNTRYSSTNTYATIWNGNDAGNLTTNNLYYTNYSANGTRFTSSVTSGTSNQRLSNSSSNIGYVQGVNKGSYTNNLNTVLNVFNNNVNSSNRYVNWNYENGTFSFKERLTTDVNENPEYTYNIEITDPYEIGQYTLRWYKNGYEDSSIQGTSYVWQENEIEDENMVVITFDGQYYAVTKFTIPKVGVYIIFNINENTNSVVADLEIIGLRNTTINDYTFQWYKVDSILGTEEIITGATSQTLNNLEYGEEYKLVATNTVLPRWTRDDSFVYGNRNLVYVDYSYGNDNNDGFSPETPVRTLSTAYGKLSNDAKEMKQNIIVIMNDYRSNSFMNSQNDSTYNKKALITGMYNGIDYNSRIYFYGSTSSYRYLGEDTTFMYLDFYGGNNQLYLYLQGYSMTIDEGVTMVGYATSNTNQGLLGGNAPAVHIICGWLRYNYAKLPRNNAELIIKSGTYGRIIGGGSPGTSGASNLQNNTSHNFMGSSMEDSFKLNITIDIKNSTTASNYDYDVNLLTRRICLW